MKTKIATIAALLALPLLAGCGGNDGKISGERELSEAEATARIAEIAANMVDNVGDQAVRLSYSATIDNAEFDGITASGSMTYEGIFDIPDGVIYEKNYVTMTGTAEGETVKTEETEENWCFDGKSATQSVSVYNGEEDASRIVTNLEFDVREAYALMELQMLTVSTASATEATYYGTDDSDSIRVSSSDDNGNSYELTFIDGRLTYAKASSDAFVVYDIGVPLEIVYNIEYRDSIDIDLPDIDNGEWTVLPF